MLLIIRAHGLLLLVAACADCEHTCYTHASIHTQALSFERTYVRTHANTHTLDTHHTRIHTRAHTHTHTRAHACTHARMHTRTHACAHIRTHARHAVVCTGHSGLFGDHVALMGWLQSVGALKLQVSFAKEPYKRDYSAKETCNFKEPTNRSHPIAGIKELPFTPHTHRNQKWVGKERGHHDEKL